MMVHQSRCGEKTYRIRFTGRIKDGRMVGSAEGIARSAASPGGLDERVDLVNNVRREVSMCTRVFGFGRPT